MIPLDPEVLTAPPFSFVTSVYILFWFIAILFLYQIYSFSE